MTNNLPSVDIILPNYNSSEFLSETLNSIFNQNFENWNLIIIDDNSDEKTRDILKKINNDKVKIIWLKKNKGQGFCRNLALRYYCKSDYVSFIDSDDLWKKSKLEEQINFMKENDIDFSYTPYEIVKSGNNKFVKNINVPLKFNFKSFIGNTSIATSSMILKNGLSKKAKFTKTRSCDDYYYKCKLLKQIKYAYCFNQTLTTYRIRPGSVQSNRLRNLFLVWKINRNLNKFSFFKSLVSLVSISFNSFKKYGLR